MTGRMEEPPLTGIISNVLHAINSLVRNEVDLARAEVSESVERAGIALGMIAAAMVIGFVALNVLTGAVVSAVVEAGLAPGWAALLVGTVYAIVAFVLINSARSRLRSASLAPRRTVANVKRDAAAVMEAADD